MVDERRLTPSLHIWRWFAALAACAVWLVVACNPDNPPCSGTQKNCGGVCRDTTSDSKNCGGCGIACGAGDPNNCGKCGITCADGFACLGGACVCGSGRAVCKGQCVSLATDTSNWGELCVGGQCQPSGPPTWSGTASEQADLNDGAGDILHRHASATITWTPFPGDPTGTVFSATGTVVITATGSAGPCTVSLPATTLGVTGTLQFFPTLTPPAYTASGSPTTSTGCLEYTYTCPDGTTQMCGDVKPWLETGQVPIPTDPNTISGTTPTQSGISYKAALRGASLGSSAPKVPMPRASRRRNR